MGHGASTSAGQEGIDPTADDKNSGNKPKGGGHIVDAAPPDEAKENKFAPGSNDNKSNVSSAKLKKIALGQPGYKEVQRDYDQTLGAINFNKPSVVNWNSEIPVTETKPVDTAVSVPSTLPSIAPRAPPPRALMNNATSGGVPTGVPAGVPLRAGPPPRVMAPHMPAPTQSIPNHPTPAQPSALPGSLPVVASPAVHGASGGIKALPPRKVAGGSHPLGVGMVPVLAPSSLPAPTAPMDAPPVLREQYPGPGSQTPVPSATNAATGPRSTGPTSASKVTEQPSSQVGGPRRFSAEEDEIRSNGPTSATVPAKTLTPKLSGNSSSGLVPKKSGKLSKSRQSMESSNNSLNSIGQSVKDYDDDDDDEDDGGDSGGEVYDWLAGDTMNDVTKASSSAASLSNGKPPLVSPLMSQQNLNSNVSNQSNSNTRRASETTHAVASETPGEPPRRIPVKPFPGTNINRQDSIRSESDDEFIQITKSVGPKATTTVPPVAIPALSLNFLAPVTGTADKPIFKVAGNAGSAPQRPPGGVPASKLTGAAAKANTWQKYLPDNSASTTGASSASASHGSHSVSGSMGQDIILKLPRGKSDGIASSSGPIAQPNHISYNKSSLDESVGPKKKRSDPDTDTVGSMPTVGTTAPMDSSQHLASSGPGTNMASGNLATMNASTGPNRSNHGGGASSQSEAGPRQGMPRGLAPRPQANPHAVKETSDVKRNRAQLPTVTTHAKPTTGDWLKKRYIVNNYILLDTLGEGSYGEVRLCKERVTDQLFAIKIISKDMLNKKKNGKTSETYFEDIKREIAIMKKLLHPNVLRLYEVLDDPKINKLYLVLEYMKQGDLVQLLKDREVTNNAAASAAPNLPLIAGESAGSSAASASQPTVSAVTGKLTSASGYTLLTDIEFWNIFRQVTAGVRYLHLQNIVHGDIKPQNLLVSEDGVVKIADFGISKMMSASSNKVEDAAGTPAFMSPELFDMHEGQAVSGPLADIWALGATMFMLRFGHPPFIAGNIMHLGNKIRNDPLVFPQPIDNGLRDLLENMLVKDPAKRFDLQKVLAHPYLRYPPSGPGRLVVAGGPQKQVAGTGSTPTKGPGPGVSSIGSPNITSTKGVSTGTASQKARAVIDFKPPESYHKEEQDAMCAAVTTVNQTDIFASIGVGVQKRHKEKGSSKANLLPRSSSTRDGQAEVEAKGDEVSNEDIMKTNWGGDVFEHVDDVEIDSDVDDSDEEVDDDVDGDSKAKSRVSSETKMSGEAVVMLSDSSIAALAKGEMSAEEEERRLKRFQLLQTKKSFDYERSMELKKISSSMAQPTKLSALSASFNSSDNNSSQSQQSQPRTPTSKDSSAGASPSPGGKKQSRRNNPRTPSIMDGSMADEYDDEETESVDMEGFAKMMDTLARQPRVANAESTVLNVDLSETVVSTQLKNDINGVKAAFYSEKGPRQTQEDRCVLLPDMGAMRALAEYDFGDDGYTREVLKKFSVGGVFDGHSGWRCAEYLSQHICPQLAIHPKLLEKNIDAAILETFAEIESQICSILSEEDDSSGSTAAVCVYDGRRNVFTVAMVGDSMCVLSRGGKAHPMISMHRLTNGAERKRIEAAGGTILNNRVNGILAVSRAFGDIQFKDKDSGNGGQVVIAVPEIYSEVITPMTEFAIIATDGLWDVMSPQAAINLARETLASASVDLRDVAQGLVKQALKLGSVDNVTVLVISFHM